MQLFEPLSPPRSHVLTDDEQLTNLKRRRSGFDAYHRQTIHVLPSSTDGFLNMDHWLRNRASAVPIEQHISPSPLPRYGG